MISVSILNLYAEGFESLVKLPGLSIKKSKKNMPDNKQEAAQTKPAINYFAGPTNVFEPELTAAL